MPAAWKARTISRNSCDLAVLRAAGGVGRLRGGEGDAVVAPEVAQLLAGQRVDERAVVLVELVDRQQLDGRDAQPLQVGDLLDQAGEGARVRDAATTGGR